MIEDDGGFLRRETYCDDFEFEEDLCVECGGAIGDDCICDEDDDLWEDDGQPTMYEEYQDLYGGDDWDHGQYDEY